MTPSFRTRAALRLLAAACLLTAAPACSGTPANSLPGDAATAQGTDSSTQSTDSSTPSTDSASSSVEAGPGPSGVPLGVYDRCAFTTFLGTPGGGGLAGAGGSIVVNQAGSMLNVTYGGDGGVLDASLAFTPTSDISASLVAGQDLSGIQVACAPLEFAPAVTQLASGSLAYNAGTLFFSVIGTVEPITTVGDCSNPGGPGAFLVTCSNATLADAGTSDAGARAPADGSGFVGVYQCDTATQQLGGNLISVESGYGTLNVTKTGQVLTAAYADQNIAGSLAFVATADNAAAPAATNESMKIQCASVGVPPASPVLTSVQVASSMLALDGDQVVLGFAGSGCGEDYSVFVLCAPNDDGGVVGAGAGDASGGDGSATDGASPMTDSASAVPEGG
jgi:hypothetical protein